MATDSQRRLHEQEKPHIALGRFTHVWLVYGGGSDSVLRSDACTYVFYKNRDEGRIVRE